MELPEDLGAIKLISINRLNTEPSENIIVGIDSDGTPNKCNSQRGETTG